MQVVARQDRQGVHLLILYHFVFIAGCSHKAKTTGGILGAQPRSGSDHHAFKSVDILQRRQQDRRCKISCPQHTQTHSLRSHRLAGIDFREIQCRARGSCCLQHILRLLSSRICEQHPQEGFLRLAGDQFIGARCLL